MTDKQTIYLLLPEIVLLLTAIVVIVGGAFSRTKDGWIIVSAVGAVVSAAAFFTQRGLFAGEAIGQSGPLILDSLGGTLRGFSLALAVLFVLTLGRTAIRSQTTEFLGMVLLVFAGLSLSCWAGNLVLLFVSLELISVPTYVLLFLGRGDDASAEATAKYFFLSLLSSAMFLLGLSLMFGVTGSANLMAMREYFVSVGAGGGPGAPLVTVATVMLFAGLGFKIAAVPFHFYAPDVYQSTTNGIAGLLAVVPKVAGIVVLLRMLIILLPAQLSFGWQAAIAMSMLTMTIGNVCALWQKNIRRMMAFSSIAHAGYMLIGLSVGLAVATGGAGADTSAVYGGFSATMLYLVVYAIGTLGTFAVLCEVGEDVHERSGKPLDDVDQLAGLSKRRPWMAGVLAVCMFSLSGIPPLAGFWGKMTLFVGAMDASRTSEALTNGGPWFLVLAIVGVLNAAIAAAYYLRIVGVSYFVNTQDSTNLSDTSSNSTTQVGTAAVAALVCAVLLIAAGLFPRVVVERFDRVGAALVLPEVAVSNDAAIEHAAVAISR